MTDSEYIDDFMSEVDGEDDMISLSQTIEESIEKETEFVRYADPLSDEELNKLISENKVPRNTQKSINWVVRLFEDWREKRNEGILSGKSPGLSVINHKVADLNLDELNYSLSRFIAEVRKVDGTEYPPKTLRHMVLMIQAHLRQHDKNVAILNDDEFRELQNTLDSKMKVNAKQGLGLTVKRPSVVTYEETMWSKGVLGDSSPSVLLDIVVYLFGINFAWRSGDEHRSLMRPQITVHPDYLEYTENVSKTNNRGLQHYNVEQKVVRAYENKDNPERCIVRLYKKYLDLCPDNAAGPVYLHPLKRPHENRWYGCAPVGRNTLSNTVKHLCESAGIEGYFTNHSLRATCATRLFQSDLDEQLICKTTGHRSNAVRSYKRASKSQEAEISGILQGPKPKYTCVEPSTSEAGNFSASVNLNFNK